MKIYFDGGCQPNPGKMESAVVARGQIYHCPDLGHGSTDSRVDLVGGCRSGRADVDAACGMVLQQGGGHL